MSVNLLGTLAEKTKTAFDAASMNAAKAAGAVAHGAGAAAGAVAHGAGTAAGAIAETAGNVTEAISSKADETVKAIKEHSRESVVKKAKVSAFRDGINEGASLMVSKVYAYSFALVALTMYVARCDGDVAEQEIEQLKSSLKHLCADENVPQAIKDELDAIACNEGLSFEDVRLYLDNLSIATLDSLLIELDEAIKADDKITAEEESARLEFEEYVAERRLAGASEDV